MSTLILRILIRHTLDEVPAESSFDALATQTSPSIEKARNSVHAVRMNTTVCLAGEKSLLRVREYLWKFPLVGIPDKMVIRRFGRERTKAIIVVSHDAGSRVIGYGAIHHENGTLDAARDGTAFDLISHARTSTPGGEMRMMMLPPSFFPSQWRFISRA